ncbi:MAG TPA: hypothetical protein VFP40_12865 [Terriglobales bacterium]|nr:hypothetical protein [Terriglobales bacterium]
MKTARLVWIVLVLFAGLLLAQAVKEIGSTETSEWSDTSKEAAATDEQKAWLNKGKVQTVQGEVVDVSCYMQLGKTGPKHADCGARCARMGQPVGILTSDKTLYLVLPEEHHPRRDGKVDIRGAFANLMGQQVKVTGMVQQTAQGKAIFVNSAEANKLKS